jgi:two-component system chemotaxis response regulator CheB
MIRVVIADDSATARAMIVAVLESDPGISVVGEARTGADAMALAIRLRPDLITMDIEMPGMDGIEGTREIMERAPVPIVIVSSSANGEVAGRSLDATAAGALYVIDKPSHPDSARFDEWSAELVSVVKAMAFVKVVRRARRAGETTARTGCAAGIRPPASAPVRLVAIAASTGGPTVLRQILARLPADLAVPVIIVQHIARGFTPALVGWLATGCSLRVKVAEDGEALCAGTVFLGPDERQLGVRDGVIALSDVPAVGGFRPAATYLFESAADSYGRDVVGVVLTGMGADGVDGLRRIRAAGGRVLAQDEESCVVFGMPREAIRAGVVDSVLSPEAIADQIVMLARRSSSANQSPRR